MQAQLAVVVGLHSTAICNHNQTTAPIYSPPETSSLVSATTKAQDTERLRSFKETASRIAVKNSQASTENGTPVEAINTKTEYISHPDIVSLMPIPVLFMQGACFLFFFLPWHEPPNGTRLYLPCQSRMRVHPAWHCLTCLGGDAQVSNKRGT